MKLRIALLAATAMALPLAAQAQPVTGLYIGAGAGINFMQSQSHSRLAGDYSDFFTANARTHQREGFAALGSVGYGFGNGLRAEIEGSWRENKITSVRGAGIFAGPGQGGGRSSTYAAMLNALYDFNNVSPFVVPYVGAGVGYAWQKFHNLHAFQDGNEFCPGTNQSSVCSNGTAGNFAWQLIAGAAFPIAAMPGLSLTAEYRFFSAISGSSIHVNAVCSEVGEFNCGKSSRVGAQYNHSILLGARYEFNKAPMAVMAQPAMPIAPGRSFLVFFDWDKFNLTDRARAVIRDAAATSKSVQHTRLEVNGYADTSGTPRYNMPLSMKRAQTVAAELVRNGVARNEIVIKAFGDTVLLVPTGPGVREPQNRRVEIIIR